MPDVATARTRDVTVGVSGTFGRASSAIFGGPVTFFRQSWNATTQVDYWGNTAYAQVTASDPTGAYPPPVLHGPDPGVQPAGTVPFWLTLVGPAVKIYKFYVTAPAAYTWTGGTGSYTLNHTAHCVQHLRPDAYEVRTWTDFTMTGSADVVLLDTATGTTVSTSSPSATMTAAEATAAGIPLGSPSNYQYSFHFNGVGLSFDTTAGISFNYPGLTNGYSGISTTCGNTHLTGGGASCAFHWSGGEGAINPGWAGSTVPSAQISFEGDWALTLGSDVYHYADGTEVGATIDHWGGTNLVASFPSGTSYRYPGAGFMRWLHLDSFVSGANSAGTGFLPGVPGDWPLTGSDYGPVARLLQTPGAGGGASSFRFQPAWANTYGTYVRAPLHPVPAPGPLSTKVWAPYVQGALTFDPVHRWRMFESDTPPATDSLASYTTEDASGDAGAGQTILPTADADHFALGDNVQVGQLGDGSITAIGTAPPSITLDTLPVFGLVPRGTAITLIPSRWAAGNVTAGSSFPPGWDTAPKVHLETGTGIDGDAIGITCTAPTQAETSLRWLLLHQGYRYARLRLMIDALSTTLSGATLVGATELPVAWERGFQVGDQVAVGAGAALEVVTVSATAVGTLTVSALAFAHSAGEKVARTDAGSLIFSIANVDTVGWTVDRPRTTLDLAAPAGSTTLQVASTEGFAVGNRVNIGEGAAKETRTIAAVGAAGAGTLTVDLTAGAHLAGSPLVLSLGEWFTAELDLAAPPSEFRSDAWGPATRIYQPFEFAPDPQPMGANHGASLAILPSGAGVYRFDYLEGYYRTDGDRTPLLIFPFLDGYGDTLEMRRYDAGPALGSSAPVYLLRWVVNGVLGANVLVHSEHTSQTLWWQYLQQRYDSATHHTDATGASVPNDTGITVRIGPAGGGGAPDPLMVFWTGGMGEFRFDGILPALYGMAPAPGDVTDYPGQLRSSVLAYYGAGDLEATSGGYGAVIGLHADWCFDGEVITNAGAAGAALTLDDDDSGATLVSAVTDDDWMARLPWKYGVYKPYDNLDGSAEWANPPDPFVANLMASYPAGSTTLSVDDAGGFTAGDAVLLTAAGETDETTTILSLSTGLITVPPTAYFHSGQVTRKFSEYPGLVYGALGLNLNAYWMGGDISPVDTGGYWTDSVEWGGQTVPERVPVVILDRYQTFLRPVASFALEPSNLADEYGKYWRADILAGTVRVQYASATVPPFATAAMLGGGGSDTRPKMALTARRRLELLFTRSAARAGQIMTAFSDTEGLDFSEPEPLSQAAPGSSHPAIASHPDSFMLARAWREGDGTLKAILTHPGEARVDAVAFALTDGTAPLNLDDDSYALVPGHWADGRWWLFGMFGGQPKLYFSADELATWRHFADLLPGGRHPNLAIDKGDGMLVAGAWILGEIHLTALWPGEGGFAAPVPVTGSGGPLSFAAGGFGLSAATEEAGRWVLVGIVAGENSASEWWSTSDDWSFKRVT